MFADEGGLRNWMPFCKLTVMGNAEKVLLRILRGASDTNIRFEELCNLLVRLGFERRTKGSHNIFRKEGVAEKINIQKEGNKAKPYQVRQVRDVILRYGLGEIDDA